MNAFGGFRPRKLGGDAARERERALLRRKMLLCAIAGAALVLLTLGPWHLARISTVEARVEVLEQDNRRLGEEAGVARLALEMERATTSGLERQLAELTDALKKNRAELEFLKSRSATPKG